MIVQPLVWHCGWCQPLTDAQQAEPQMRYTTGICPDCRATVQQVRRRVLLAALQEDRARGARAA